MDQYLKRDCDDFEELMGKKLTEPDNHEDVRKILEYVRLRNGFLDDDDEAELQGSQVKMQRRMRFIARNQRRNMASRTTS